MFGIIAGIRRTVLERDEGNGFRTVGAGVMEPVFDRWVVITFGSPSPEAIFSVEGFGRPTFFGQELPGRDRFYWQRARFLFPKTGNFVYICWKKDRRGGYPCGRVCTDSLACKNQSENMVLAEQIKEAIRRQDTLGRCL